MRSQILSSFASAAGTYDDYAHVQRDSALALVSCLNEWRLDIPPGQALELGCGTGLLTQHLLARFPDHRFTVSDASEEMLAQCRGRLRLLRAASPNMVQFETIDADVLERQNEYSLIASSFALQWLVDLPACLARFIRSLRPGGVMIFAVPVSGCFSEWRQICDQINVPFSANPLPDPDVFREAARSQACSFQGTVASPTYIYSSPLLFFRSMKLLGAGTTLDVHEQLGVSKLRRLVRTWGSKSLGKVAVTYRILYGQVKRAE